MVVDQWPVSSDEDVIDMFRRGMQTSGLNQRQLSEMLGISQKHMSMMMLGKANISLNMMFRICEHLNIHPCFLHSSA